MGRVPGHDFFGHDERTAGRRVSGFDRIAVDRGLIEPPFFIQLIFGILGGAGAELDNLMHMHRVAERLFGGDYEWSVLAAGRHQLSFATTAAMLGGNAARIFGLPSGD